MGSRALILLTIRASSITPAITTAPFFSSFRQIPFPAIKKSLPKYYKNQRIQKYSTAKSSLELPHLPRLAETARISLTPDEVEEFAPKIREVVDWFGQLQAIDLESIEPAIRAAGSADTEGDNFRDDLPEKFENSEAIITAVPSYEESYIKVPKVLNKE